MLNKTDVLKLLGISEERGDRIIGGMTRISTEYRSWNKVIKNSLKLADNDAERNLVWYLIGSRIGMIMTMENAFKPMKYEPSLDSSDKFDPSIY